MTERIVWRPAAADTDNARITAFAREASARAGCDLRSYADLHRWAVENLAPVLAFVGGRIRDRMDSPRRFDFARRRRFCARAIFFGFDFKLRAKSAAGR